MWPRSSCPHCHHQLPWYDLIPVISWVVLKGSCRSCKKPISLLYPCIELLTVVLMMALYCTVPFHYFPAYFLFFSALIVTIRSDMETMLISRYVTLFLVPLGLLFSLVGLLPISLLDSITGAFLGYFFLWAMARGFYRLTHKHGIGQGDLELLSFIGSFLGVLGCWASLLLGAVIGSLVGVGYIAVTRSSHSVKIPFGPFLALGAISYVLFQDFIIGFFQF